MAIVTFWSKNIGNNAQTSSLLASALQMAIDRNLKILVLDADFNKSAIKEAFIAMNDEKEALTKQLNMGKIDISTGLEGVLSAIGSNKTSPEVVKSFSVPIFTDRLDIMYGFRTNDLRVYTNEMFKVQELLKVANQYYDLIYVDLYKGETEFTLPILELSDLIIYPLAQDIKQITEFKSLWGVSEVLKNKVKVIPIIGKEDSFSKYNCDNVARKIGMKPGMSSVVYNTLYMEALQEGKIVDLFMMFNNQSSTQRNNYILRTVEDLNLLILDRIQQLRYQR